MLPDRVSNPGPLTYESGALQIALRGEKARERERERERDRETEREKEREVEERLALFYLYIYFLFSMACTVSHAVELMTSYNCYHCN